MSARSIIEDQLEALDRVTTELRHLGCHVISFGGGTTHERPRVLIHEPGALLDHLDAQSIATSGHRFLMRGVVWHGVDVYWLMPRPAPTMKAAA